MHKIEGAHLQCVTNPFAKYEYKRMKTFGVTDYTNQHHQRVFDVKMSLTSTPRKNEKVFMKCAQNHYTKFEYKGMKKFGVTLYINWAPQKCCGRTDVVDPVLDLLSLKRRRLKTVIRVSNSGLLHKVIIQPPSC